MPTLAPVEARPALAGAIARRLYGHRPTVIVRLPSEDNLVVRLEFGGLPAKVLKLPGGAARLGREQQVLRRLRAPRLALPVPAIEFTQEDLPPQWLDGNAAHAPPHARPHARPRALTVMRMAEGMPLADAVLRGEPWAGDALRAAGAFAARLADVPAASVLPGARLIQPHDQLERSLLRTAQTLERCELPGPSPDRSRRRPRGRAVTAFLDVLRRLQRRPATSLVHGELYLQNILAGPAAGGGGGLCIVDWKSARPGFPLADLAALLASLARLPIADPGAAAFMRRRAMDGFAAARPLDAADQAELAAWEAFAHLSADRARLDAGRHERASQPARLAAKVLGL